MFYEIKASACDLDGKKAKFVALVQDVNHECAINKFKEMAAGWSIPVNFDDIDSIRPIFKLAEIINENELGKEGLTPYMADVKADYHDAEGNEISSTWSMACAAVDNVTASKMFAEHLSQGYDGFVVKNVKEKSWKHFLF